jgi:hypothetical protein
MNDLTAPPAPVEVAPGRIGWPDVFVYAGRAANVRWVSPLPPPVMPYEFQLRLSWLERFTGGATPHPGVQPRSFAYTIEIRPGRLAEFERLFRSGALCDPRHTGVERSVVEG